jgi:hypothetical protein
MKDICVKLIVIIGWAIIFVALPVLNIIPVPGLDLFSEVEIGTAPVFAAKQELKAGMIDPKTGKKIKYWVAPMNPSYIRDGVRGRRRGEGTFIYDPHRSNHHAEYGRALRARRA